MRITKNVRKLRASGFGRPFWLDNAWLVPQPAVMCAHVARDIDRVQPIFHDLKRIDVEGCRNNISTVRGDRYGGQWVTEQFAGHGMRLEPSELNKSEIYGELLPMLNSRAVALLDNDRLVHQLNSLERRRGRTGRDTIDHPKGGHDDLINAAAGALVLAQDGSSTSVPGFDRVISYENNGSIV